MHSTLKDLKIYDIAHERKLKEIDQMNYLNGQYMFAAVSAAVGNLFRGKTKKAISYHDAVEQPLLMHMEEEKKEESGELSVDEKKRRTEALFHKLDIMAANWRLSKQAKEREAKESGEVE